MKPGKSQVNCKSRRFGEELLFLTDISKRSQQPSLPEKSATNEDLGIYICYLYLYLFIFIFILHIRTCITDIQIHSLSLTLSLYLYIYNSIYIYIYCICVTKLHTKTGHENMQNQQIKRDCGRARNAQGSPKAGARATFVQNNLAQPPFVSYNINHHPNHHFFVACFS